MYKAGMTVGTVLMIGAVITLIVKTKKLNRNDVIAGVCMLAVIAIGISEIL